MGVEYLFFKKGTRFFVDATNLKEVTELKICRIYLQTTKKILPPSVQAWVVPEK